MRKMFALNSLAIVRVLHVEGPLPAALANYQLRVEQRSDNALVRALDGALAPPTRFSSPPSPSHRIS